MVQITACCSRLLSLVASIRPSESGAARSKESQTLIISTSCYNGYPIRSQRCIPGPSSRLLCACKSLNTVGSTRQSHEFNVIHKTQKDATPTWQNALSTRMQTMICTSDVFMVANLGNGCLGRGLASQSRFQNTTRQETRTHIQSRVSHRYPLDACLV